MEHAHTTIADNVAVRTVVHTDIQSTASAENYPKMAALLSKLGK